MTTRIQIKIKDNNNIIWEKSFSTEYDKLNDLIQKLNDIRA